MAKKGRTRLQADEVATREQAETILGEHARLTAQLEALEASLAADIVAVESKYEGLIEALKANIKGKTKLLNTWATANPDEFAKGKKSLEFIYGRLGFRTTPLKVSILKKSKVEAILNLLRMPFPSYIRQVEELNRDAIIADYSEAEKNEDPTVLAKLQASLNDFDLKVGRSETFFVEPKLEPSKTQKEEGARS